MEELYRCGHLGGRAPVEPEIKI